MVQSKQILSASGYLSIDFIFKVKNDKRTYFTHGNSKVSNNVKANKDKLMRDAIWNGVIKIFPDKSKYYNTIDVYGILIVTYNIVYFVDRYMIVEKKGKYYERFRDKDKKRTVYSAISDKKEYKAEQEVYE